MLERMGVDTGLDLERLAAIVPWIEDKLGKRVPGLLSKAGLFPATRSLNSGSMRHGPHMGPWRPEGQWKVVTRWRGGRGRRGRRRRCR